MRKVRRSVSKAKVNHRVMRKISGSTGGAAGMVREMKKRAQKAKEHVKVSKRAADRAWKRSVSAERGLKKHKQQMRAKRNKRDVAKRRRIRAVDRLIKANRARARASRKPVKRGGNSEFVEIGETNDSDFEPDVEMQNLFAEDFDRDYDK